MALMVDSEGNKVTILDEKDPISTRVIEEIEECDEDSVEMSYGAVGPSQHSH